jgi:hypothetical protein
MTNYYRKIFLEHKRKDPNKNPAPKNFWPYNYQFFLCNPVLVFSAIVEDANTAPVLTITHYIEPTEDRDNHPSIGMPVNILYPEELLHLITTAPRDKIESNLNDGSFDDLRYILSRPKVDFDRVARILPSINEDLRSYLALRDTDRAATARSPYRRR